MILRRLHNYSLMLTLFKFNCCNDILSFETFSLDDTVSERNKDDVSSEIDEDVDEPEPCWIGKGRKERVVFPEQDLDDIHRHFREILIATPSKKVRMNVFKKVVKRPEMHQLLKKYGEQTLLSKVRTERKRCLSKT